MAAINEAGMTLCHCFSRPVGRDTTLLRECDSLRSRCRGLSRNFGAISPFLFQGQVRCGRTRTWAGENWDLPYVCVNSSTLDGTAESDRADAAEIKQVLVKVPQIVSSEGGLGDF